MCFGATTKVGLNAYSFSVTPAASDSVRSTEPSARTTLTRLLPQPDVSFFLSTSAKVDGERQNGIVILAWFRKERRSSITVSVARSFSA